VLVGIPGGRQTRTNERGDFTLTELPAGTRVLEVRAVGFYPIDLPVDIVDGAAPVAITLSTFQEVLDVIRVTARRVYQRDYAGWETRRKTGAGQYFDAADLARTNAVLVSDIFRLAPGVRLERNGVDTRITMRGTTSPSCTPSVFIDGAMINLRDRGIDRQSTDRLSASTTIDIDEWVRVADVVGIEVYASGMVPGEFQNAFDGCGAVLVWTKLGKR
jgi:hypothetical protein